MQASFNYHEDGMQHAAEARFKPSTLGTKWSAMTTVCQMIGNSSMQCGSVSADARMQEKKRDWRSAEEREEGGEVWEQFQCQAARCHFK